MRVKNKKVIYLLVGALLALLSTSRVFAQEDVEGSKDHPLISRYPGSVIVHYDVKKFDEYILPSLKEVAKLLAQNSKLNLYVVGHTDNIGTLTANMELSQRRAEAVVKALVTKYGVGAKRLKSYGVGSLSPVASNKTEEGRAKNRRVELVEQ
ncbi:MAG: OmpA family protein [bacterium]